MTAPSPLLALARRPLRRAVHDARHVTPVPYRAATGPARRIYDAVERDFGMLAPPIAVHSPAPVVMAAAWRLLRATLLLPGATSRAEREAVAAAVSRANRCPYCVAVHEASHDALAVPEQHRHLAAWAEGDAPAPPREPAELAELADVAATFEYLNRVVTVFLPESPVPPAAPAAVRERALGLLGTAARREAPGHRTATASGLLDDLATAAAAALRDPGAIAGAVDRVLHRPPEWLEDPSVDAVAGLEPAVRAPARLAVLAAAAPWRVTPAAVDAARAGTPIGGDGDVVALVATGAAAAARSRRALLAARTDGSVADRSPGEDRIGIAS